MNVSIIICTRNRIESLERTLSAIGRIAIPSTLEAELLVVDNGSTDGTSERVSGTRLPNMPVRCVEEGNPGLSCARNRALISTSAPILLFTDDDIRPPHDWIEAMCSPIIRGEAHATVGGVRLADYLKRRWMTPTHFDCLASTESASSQEGPCLLGANMAISREVFSQVPSFDIEIGAGRLGCYEDTLFGWQVERAGYRINALRDVVVEHHCSQDRLARACFLDSAARGGRTRAYLAYHWRHSTVFAPRLRALKAAVKLRMLRTRRKSEITGVEGAPVWEMTQILYYQFFTHYLVERARPRNYEDHGLIKRAGDRYEPASCVPAGSAFPDLTGQLRHNTSSVARCVCE